MAVYFCSIGMGAGRQLVMRLTDWLFGSSPSRYIVLNGPDLTDDELAGAFAVAPDHKLIRALLQVTRELEEEANDSARITVGNHGMCASANGGAEYMSRFRQRILELREKGFGKLSK